MNPIKKILNNFSVRKLLYNKRFTVPFSVFIAFVFWLIIMINQNPVRQQTFTDVPVNVNLEGTVAGENGMGIVGDIAAQKFTVVVSGPNYIVSSLKTDDFALYASAAEITEPGTYDLEVFGTRGTAKSGYTFVSYSPSHVKVTLDYIDTKEFEVVPKLVGVAVSDGLVAETPIVSAVDNTTESDTITVKGPRSVLNTINEVVAYAEVNKTLSSSQTYDASLLFYDADENEVDTSNLEINAEKVKVTVPISKKATVRVKPAFSNLPSGLTQSDINFSVNHDTVTIIGTPDVVSAITEISLTPIDFTKVSTSSNKFDVSPVLPDGVKILDSIDYFIVSIDTSGYAEKTFTISNVKFNNLNSGLTAKNSSSIRNVKICGPKSVIYKINSSDIYALVDLKGKSAGEHSVNVTVKSDSYTNIWQVGTYSTTVNIS